MSGIPVKREKGDAIDYSESAKDLAHRCALRFCEEAQSRSFRGIYEYSWLLQDHTPTARARRNLRDFYGIRFIVLTVTPGDPSAFRNSYLVGGAVGETVKKLYVVAPPAGVL
jgi:hypothetical protein